MPKPEMSPFAEQIEHDFKFALDTLRRTGSLRPMFVIETPDDTIIMPSGWNSAREKSITIKVLRLACFAYDASAVSMLAEAWMRVVERRHGETDAEREARARAVPVNEAEDRIEVVSLARAERGPRGVVTKVAAREIMRDATGTVVALKAIGRDDDGEGVLDGWISDMISPMKVSAELRARARDLLKTLKVELETLHRPV